MVTYSVDLDTVLKILRFDGQKQRPEPLKRPEISADPEEVYLPEPRLALGIIHPIPDTLEDRCKRRDTNTRTN